MIKHISVFTALPLLAACGSSVTGPSQTYQTLTSTAAETSPLIGRGRPLSDAVVAGMNLVTSDVAGNIDHGTGAVTFGLLTDSDGFDANGALIDPNVTTSSSPVPPEFFGTYDFVRTYQFISEFGGSEGFIGIATAPSDMPTTNSATFTGESSGFGPNGPWTGAPTTITANFGTNRLGITANQTVGGTTGSITVTDAVISGNAINGGTLTATRGGAAVNVTTGGILGDITNIDGYFYGYDATNNTPDEIGIEIGTFGADGSVDLTILAD